MPWEIKEEDGQHCVHREDTGAKVKCHATRAEAEAHMKALYANEPMHNGASQMTDDGHLYLLEDYVATRPGEPYRLFQFGRIIKNGKVREITKEVAAAFKLPHFKPPVKLGSHDETTPAGGHIIGLEVREDGLYAVPEFTDKGAQALEEGAYRYHSPEVIWSDGGLEDPVTGEMIQGPLIVGDALLHTPHLGEAAALYSIEPIVKEKNDMAETIEVPTGLWDKFVAWFGKRVDEAEPQPEAPVTPPTPEIPEEFKARLAEAEQYKAKVETMEAEAAKKARLEHFGAELQTTKYSGNTEAAELLAGMTEEQSGKVLEYIKALSAQIDESKLTGEVGSAAPGEVVEGEEAINAAVKAEMEASKVGYVQAFEAIRSRNPELFKI
jgi:hypothetical protein